MASDEDFFVLRRFGTVGARVALYLQDRVVELEEKLYIIDKSCEELEPGLNNGTFRYDPSDERKDIMKNLSIEFERYRMSHQ